MRLRHSMNATKSAIRTATRYLVGLLTILAVTAALAGCGQMGPLYLEKQEPATQQAADDAALGNEPDDNRASSTVPTEDSLNTVNTEDATP